MAYWYVPVNVMEIGRFVVVQAESPAEAAKKARRAEWERLTDDEATSYRVVVRKAKIEPAPDEA